MQQGKITPELIAPCGMNCGICKRYLAYSRGIPEERGKVIHCQGCLPSNKNCYIKRGCKKIAKKEVKFCFECYNMPCENLNRLERRYRKQYNMSMIENLKELKDKGMEKYLKNQESKYKCSRCGDIISVHDRKCYACGNIETDQLNSVFAESENSNLDSNSEVNLRELLTILLGETTELRNKQLSQF